MRLAINRHSRPTCGGPDVGGSATPTVIKARRRWLARSDLGHNKEDLWSVKEAHWIRRPLASIGAQGVRDAPVLGQEIEEGSYDWKYGSKIHYLHSGSKGPSILLVHGFGVGSYHFCHNIHALSKNHKVWAVDLLGQNRSWPERDPLPDEKLYYSVDTWTEQLKDFVDTFIGEPVYVVGNSLGGYLAISLASQHPERIKAVFLLNAAPFWAFMPPVGGADMPGSGPSFKLVDAAVPVPPWLKNLLAMTWWANLKRPETVKQMIELVYHNRAAADEKLIEQIVDATKHPRALEAFTAIMFAPKSKKTFDEMVMSLRCPVHMLYGREDPWVVPMWGQRLKRRVPNAVYYEISPAGHCPHHEAPQAVNYILDRAVRALEAQTVPPLPKIGDRIALAGMASHPPVTVTHVDGSPRNLFERVDEALWRIGRLLSRQGV